jgi:hypothetical protein
VDSISMSALSDFNDSLNIEVGFERLIIFADLIRFVRLVTVR